MALIYEVAAPKEVSGNCQVLSSTFENQATWTPNTSGTLGGTQIFLVGQNLLMKVFLSQRAECISLMPCILCGQDMLNIDGHFVILIPQEPM